MPPLVELILWLLITLAEAFIVGLFIRRGLFRRFLWLNSYFSTAVLISIGRYAVLSRHGLTSSDYMYAYYLTDSLLTVVLYLSICELGVRLAGSKLMVNRIIPLSIAVFLIVTWGTYLDARVQNEIGSGMHHQWLAFAVVLSQNLMWACYLGAPVILIWRLISKSDDLIAWGLLRAMCVSLALILLASLSSDVSAHHSDGEALFGMAGAWLPVGCGFAVVSREHARVF